MKKFTKLLMILVGACLMLFGVSMLAGCSPHKLTVADLEERGYTYTVTFDLQGGKSDNQTVRRLRVKPDSKIPEPDAVANFSAPVLADHTFNAFYLGSEDEDGNVAYGKRWDFKTDKVNEDITLYAKWLPNYKITVHYGDYDYAEKNYTYEKTYTYDTPMDSEGVAKETTLQVINGFTVLSYYKDEACTEEIQKTGSSYKYTPDCSEESPVDHIYAKGRQGKWAFVETAKQLKDLSIGFDTNILLLKDIDMYDICAEGEDPQKADTSLKLPQNYGATFDGGGHTLSHISINYTTVNKNDVHYGVFRQIAASAVIRDITFADVTATYTLINPMVTDYFVGLLIGSAAQGSKVMNVTLTGTLTCSVIDNKTEDVTEGLYETTIPRTIAGNRDKKPDDWDYDDTGVTIVKNKYVAPSTTEQK